MTSLINLASMFMSFYMWIRPIVIIIKKVKREEEIENNQ